MRNWLIQIRRLRSPTVCYLQAGDPVKPVVWSGIESESEGLRTKGASSVNIAQRAREDDMKCPSSISKARKKGQILSSIFCFIWALN